MFQKIHKSMGLFLVNPGSSIDSINIDKISLVKWFVKNIRKIIFGLDSATNVHFGQQTREFLFESCIMKYLISFCTQSLPLRANITEECLQTCIEFSTVYWPCSIFHKHIVLLTQILAQALLAICKPNK